MAIPTATLLSLFIIISTFFSANSLDTPNGLTIKLIHRYSPESPFYSPNLTLTEKIKTLVSQTKNRARSWNQSDIRAGVILDVHVDAAFLAQIGIGKSNSITPFKKYYVHMDTGSAETWIQCAECKAPGKHCFSQRDGPYEAFRSISYKKLPCNGPNRHRLCDPNDCIGEYCGYHLEYLDNSKTTGFLSLEDFTFGTETVPGIVFGCGIDNVNFDYGREGIVAGLLGLGRGDRSFVAQLGPRSNGRFSYCLQNQNGDVMTYLTFGADIPRATNTLSSTPMTRVLGREFYYVNLVGIGVEGVPIKVTRRDFALRNDGTGGCVMDSGSSFTILVPRVYDALIQHLVGYFNRVGGFRRVDLLMEESFDLCYESLSGGTEGFNNLPKITFNFGGGAALHLEARASYLFGTTKYGKKFFCLAMMKEPSNLITIIGAYQQMYHRFVYSTRNNMLFFGPENCGH